MDIRSLKRPFAISPFPFPLIPNQQNRPSWHVRDCSDPQRKTPPKHNINLIQSYPIRYPPCCTSPLSLDIDCCWLIVILVAEFAIRLIVLRRKLVPYFDANSPCRLDCIVVAVRAVLHVDKLWLILALKELA